MEVTQLKMLSISNKSPRCTGSKCLLSFLSLQFTLLLLFWRLDTTSTFSFSASSSANQQTTKNLNEDESEDSSRRRNLLASVATAPLLFVGEQPASAAFFGGGRRMAADLYVVTPDKNATDSLLQREPVLASPYALSSELCLLKLLPVKNAFFRQLQAAIEGVSRLHVAGQDPDAWKEVSKQMEEVVSDIDKKRGLLEPVFNPDDNSLMQITKAERGERLIEALRSRLVELKDAALTYNATKTFDIQKDALLALSEVGELLVSAFPYEVPTEGKYSYLPRLLGRTKVTFSIRRKNSFLGNITIIADGFAAPITAGNFVDLSLRNFYTGLPIKFTRKRAGSGSDFEVASIPILGSYEEGFYDPLTAKLRQLPLEIIRLEKTTGLPSLSYSQGLSSPGGKATLEPTVNSRPLLSFDIPGLVAMNHPDKNLNGASSEFFSLQTNSMFENKRALLDGEYAPFGYITDGLDVFQRLRQGDVIDSTFVDEWGRLNLVKLRESSFLEVVQGGNDEE